MNNIYDVFNEQEVAQETMKYTKSEYGKMMGEKKKELFELANNMVDKVIENKESFLNYLDLQNRFDYTVTNTMLIMAQNPNAKVLKDFQHWREQKRYVSKNAKGIYILEPAGEYRRKDGSIAPNYRAKKVFDISELSNGPKLEALQAQYNVRELLSALVYTEEIKPTIVAKDSEMPTDVYYDSTTNNLYVKEGLDGNEMVKQLIREYCFVELNQYGIDRDSGEYLVECATYGVGSKYNLNYDTRNIEDNFNNYFVGKEPKNVREDLNTIKNLGDSIKDKVERGLYLNNTEKQEKQKKEMER